MRRLWHIVFVLALTFCWCVSAWAQTKRLPDVTSTEGREFFVAWLPNGGSNPQDLDLKLQLMASSRKANRIRVEYANGSSEDYNIGANRTVTIVIDPQSVYWDSGKEEEEKPLSKGIRIYSLNDELFTLYSTNQIGVTGSYSFDGAHILPVEALGTEYIVQTAEADATATEFLIMSTKTGQTNVSINLKVNSRRGNTQQLSVTLDGPKQIYIVRSKAPNPEDPNDFIDLSGSTICADQPIAVWSGNQYAIIPYKDGYSNDHAYDQLLPINKWGKEFIVPTTACHTALNFMRIVAMQDNTTVTIKRGAATSSVSLNAGQTSFQRLNIDVNNPQNATRKVTSDKPIQVYLYSTSAGANTWYDDDGNDHVPSDPSTTLIPPLEFLTDTTIFRTFTAGDGQLEHKMNIWALTSQVNNIKLDGQSIGGQFTQVASDTRYSQAYITLTDTTHVITAPKKCFTGYAYGMNDGQAYLYPIGYDFTPKQDSLFLLDNDNKYLVHWSEWKDKAVSQTEGGWYLDKKLLDNGNYLLDSTFVCDKTTLSLPIKTYEAWYKVRWEIEGSIQGADYYTPTEQLADNVSRPELTHQFELLPKEQNDEPYEDFEVRGILIRKPIFCDIPEDKWERDTFNTIIRVLRQYNDTVWKAICIGDTVKFFYDSLYSQGNLNLSDPTKKDSTCFIATTSGAVNPNKWEYNVGLGSYAFTRHYTSSGGCDSLSTLKLFVCEPHYTRKDTVVCEEETKFLDFGEFFKKYKTSNTWPKGENVLFDTLRAKDCMRGADYDEFRPHCPNFNGCDSVMELHLNVKKLIRNNDTENHCMSSGGIFEWREKGSNRLIHTFSADTMKKDTVYNYKDYVQYVNCENCPQGGCDSVRNTLRLQWVSDAGQTHEQHVCQGDKFTYTNMDFTTTFFSVGRLCNTPYEVTGTVHVYGVVDGVRVTLCEFEDVVTFWVDTVYKDQMTYDTICWDPQNTHQTYSWANHPKFNAIPITGPGLITKVDTMKTSCDCDSICVLKLSVGQPYEVPTVAQICDDGSFEWQDTLFYGKKYTGDKPAKSKLITTSYTSHRDMLSMYGCDSILTLDLTLYPTYVAERKDTSVCANEPYDFYGTLYNTPANPWTPGQTYPLEIHDTSIHGCDSAVLHYVTVNFAYLNVREANDTVCQTKGATYDWTGHPDWTTGQSISNAGTYEIVDYMHTTLNCDSVVYKTLVVLPSYNLKFSHSMSSEEYIEWEGRIYAGEKAEVDNPESKPVIRCSGTTEIVDSLLTEKVGTHVCDSVRTLTLKIGQTFRDTTFDATCANCGTYQWVITSPITGRDTTIYITDLPIAYEEKIYYDSLLTEMGYDSIYVLRLTAYPTYSYQTGDRVCQGEPYEWTGHMPMVYDGIEHRLYVNGQAVLEIPTDQYGITQVVDSMRTDTIYTNPKTGQVKPMHCDSVWTLTLTIDKTYNDRYVNLTDYRSMASNDTISHFVTPHTLFVGYDFDYDAAGTSKAELEEHYPRVVYINRNEGTGHRDSIRTTSVNGCDSVHYVQISICEMKFTQLYDSIGDNDSTWYFGGEVGTVNRGPHTLPLVTAEKFHTYDDGTPVDYSKAEGRTMREYLFIDTLFSATGCDSIVHDLVRVFPTYRFQFDTAICSNKQYNWRTHMNLNRERTGFFYDSVGYKVGTHTFDSVYVLYLDVMPSGYWHFDTTVCKNDTLYWYYQKVYYQGNGLSYVEATYKPPESECGDVYHLDLHFAPFYGEEFIEYDTICQFEPYPWISPNETKEHTEALRDANGQTMTKIPTDVAGSFVFYDSLKTVGCGCDSTYTLNLYIKPSYHFYDTTLTLCSSDTVEWHGQKYYYQGEANVFDTIFEQSSVFSCDSNYYLRVHFDLSYDITDSLFLCSDEEHFTWEDIVFDDTLAASHYWDAPRDYFFTREYRTTISGCDSVRHLKLRIAPSYDSIWTDTLCRGETYYLFDQRLTQAGEYTDVQLNRFGCNTYYYLTLKEVPATTVNLQVEPVCVDEDGMANNYLIKYTVEGDDPPISYSIYYDSIAQSLGFENDEDVPIVVNGEVYLPVPYFAQRNQYPRPGYYDAVIAFKNGVCLYDSLMTYPFKMEMRYPSWITTQHWNDAIFIMDSTLNGGYSFEAYQWYRNDSILYGETRPYLYEPQYLHDGAEYSVALTRRDDQVTVRTCPIVPDLNGWYDKSPQQAYISVVPTAVAKENPVVYILSTTSGTYKLLNPQGQLVTQGKFQPDSKNTYPVTLPASAGIYVFHLTEDSTAGTGGDLSRTVKVIVQ